MTNNIKKNFTKIKKFKPLTGRELRVSFERLIRFNTPFDKIERVYREILIKNTIEPKINSRNFRELSLQEVNYIFQHIWDGSIETLGGKSTQNHALNLYLAYEDMKTFSAENFFKTSGANFDTDKLDNLQGLSEAQKGYIAYKMSFPPNLEGCLKLLSSKLSSNARRLAWLNEVIKKENLTLEDTDLTEKLEKIYRQACDYRKRTGSLYPLQTVVLVEGITEEILLPVFSGLARMDFAKKGVKIISSGGKNQVLRLYKSLSEEINLPILMLFDFDAVGEVECIKNSLREIDDIYIISRGEFEDILPDGLICRAVNNYYRLTGSISLKDIKDSEKKSHTLTELWKEKGFGEFKKAEFARIIADNISKKTDMSEELMTIFEKIEKKLN